MNSFESLIEENIPRLRRYAFALLGDRCNADDLVQDSLERALSRQHLWDRNRDIRPWLFTIMHNLFANAARRYNKAPMSYSFIEDSDAISEDDNEQYLFLRDLARSLAKLSPQQREIIMLVGLEQMSYEETADVLSVPVGTVMSRLARARKKLREIMKGSHNPVLRRVK